jgi:hypothetical protein
MQNIVEWSRMLESCHFGYLCNRSIDAKDDTTKALFKR